MKINSSYLPKTINTQEPRAKATKAQSASASSAVATEGVQKNTAATQSPFDHAKVEEIKSAIAQGRFKISPEAIADGIIQMAKDLIIHEKSA